jgi:mycoredoxin-dependent peroxiredoxin
LRQDYREFVVRDTEVLVIAPDDTKSLAEYWQKENLPMPGLVDPGHEVANSYGQQVKLLQFGRLPSMAVLDRSGAVRFEHRGANMTDIPQDKQILALLDELNREWNGEPAVERSKA